MTPSPLPTEDPGPPADVAPEVLAEVVAEVVVEVPEDLDAAAAPRVRERLAVALAQRPDRLVLDLSNSAGLHPSGLAVLLDTHHRAELQGTALLLRGLTARHRVLLAHARLDRVLQSEPAAPPQVPTQR